MFFDQEAFSFNIIDVLELKQKNVDFVNSGRNFNALSFRIHSDTILKAKTTELHLRDNFVSYVPARLDYRRIARTDEIIVIHFDTTNYTTKEIEVFESQEPERLLSLFRDILKHWQKKKLGYKLKCSAILYEILEECYIQNYRSEKPPSKIRKSVDYIHQSFKRGDLTISEIAMQSFVSEVYFRRLFREEFGVSPQKYIVNLRIQHAAGLISTGYYSLQEAAYLSGYNDYKYFSVEFKRIMGVSPSKYSYNYKA